MIIQYKLLRTTGRVMFQYELNNNDYGSMLKVNRQCEIGSLVRLVNVEPLAAII
jgi:hypothetical protein